MLEFSKLVQIHAFKFHSLHYLLNHLQNLVKYQGTLRIKTQSIRKVNGKLYQTKHLSTTGVKSQPKKKKGVDLDVKDRSF